MGMIFFMISMKKVVEMFGYSRKKLYLCSVLIQARASDSEEFLA